MVARISKGCHEFLPCHLRGLALALENGPTILFPALENPCVQWEPTGCTSNSDHTVWKEDSVNGPAIRKNQEVQTDPLLKARWPARDPLSRGKFHSRRWGNVVWGIFFCEDWQEERLNMYTQLLRLDEGVMSLRLQRFGNKRASHCQSVQCLAGRQGNR